MNDDRIPARRMPPGRTIRRELEARGWTQKDLSAIIDRPEQAISMIINGEKEITPQTAIELSNAFGTSLEFWNNLEANYRLWLAQRDREAKPIARRAQLYERLPVAELKKIRWLPDTNDIDELEKAACALTGTTSIDENPRCDVRMRRSDFGTPEAMAQVIWIKRVEHLVRNQMVGKFSRTNLKKAIPQLLGFSAQEQDVALIPRFLLSTGIRFALVPHLSKTYLDGAMFWIGKNPVIALTLRYDRLDSFWFSLMHELAHLLAGHEGAYLDTIHDRKEKAAGEEAEADRIAADLLLEPKAYGDFVDKSGPRFSRRKIEGFAAEQHRHPAIVLGRLQYDGKASYSSLRMLLVKVGPLLADFWDKPIAA